jgi:hypothetical protein
MGFPHGNRGCESSQSDSMILTHWRRTLTRLPLLPTNAPSLDATMAARGIGSRNAHSGIGPSDPGPIKDNQTGRPPFDSAPRPFSCHWLSPPRPPVLSLPALRRANSGAGLRHCGLSSPEPRRVNDQFLRYRKVEEIRVAKLTGDPFRLASTRVSSTT